MNKYLEQLENLAENGKFSYKVENEKVIFNIKAISFCVDGLENAVKYGSYIQNNFTNGMVVNLDNIGKIASLYDPKVSEDILETLNYDKDPYIRKLVVLHPNCPNHIIHQSIDDVDFNVSSISKQLWKEINNKPKDDYEDLDNPYFYSTKTRLELAKNSTNPSELNDLSFCDEYEVRLEVSQNPNIKLDTYQKLIKEDDLTILEKLVENPNCPESILKELSYCDYDSVKESIAANLNCPISILKNYSNEDNNLLRYLVSTNPNSNEKLLSKLSQDENVWVRAGVAKNDNLSLNILENLANDVESSIRSFVLDHPNVTKEILTKLSQDDDIDISSKALDKLSTFDSNALDTIDKVDSLNNVDESTSKNNHRHR